MLRFALATAAQQSLGVSERCTNNASAAASPCQESSKWKAPPFDFVGKQIRLLRYAISGLVGSINLIQRCEVYDLKGPRWAFHGLIRPENDLEGLCPHCWPLGASDLGYCICDDLQMLRIAVPTSPVPGKLGQSGPSLPGKRINEPSNEIQTNKKAKTESPGCLSGEQKNQRKHNVDPSWLEQLSGLESQS